MAKGKNNHYCAILAGGVGSRFWPLSRETAPKQLHSMVGEESLLESTIGRLSPLVPKERVFIVTSVKQHSVIRQHLGWDCGRISYIVEPSARNTAPAIGLAAVELLKKDPEAVMAVLPADHYIKSAAPFRKALATAFSVAEKGHLVTFGIKPTYPETGYGYIKATDRGSFKSGSFKVRRVARFVEKPNLARAKKYLKDGGYYWNSGIFVWKASRILEEIAEHLPLLYRKLSAIMDGGEVKRAYDAIKPISIDHGVLEKSSSVVVIEASFPWSDMGSWNSLHDVVKSDKSGNVIKGRVVDIGSRDSVIVGGDRLVATLGLDNMVVIDTADATLVCPRDRAQEVKDIVSVLKESGFHEHDIHLTVNRPWGSYTVLEEGDGYKIKRVEVEPGRRLSLQKHRRRSEHWVVVSGTALVTRGKDVFKVKKGESTFIPMGAKHRLENSSARTALEIIEIQNGSYLEEDDIVRYNDDFDRS